MAKHYRTKKIVLFSLFLLFVVVMIGAIFKQAHSLNFLRDAALSMQSLATYNYWLAVGVYIAVYILIIITCIPGAGTMSVMGGFLFGLLPAVVYINCAAVAGASLFFVAARFLCQVSWQKKYEGTVSRLGRFFSRQGWRSLLLLRCMPLIPFFMVNIFAVLTRVSLKTFLWTTSLGVIPSSLIFAFTGQKLGTMIEYQSIWPELAGISVALLLLFLFSWLLSRCFKRV